MVKLRQIMDMVIDSQDCNPEGYIQLTTSIIGNIPADPSFDIDIAKLEQAFRAHEPEKSRTQ